METRNLADLYDLPTLDWQRVVDRLDVGFTQAPGTGGPDRHTCWLATIDADGRPHVTGIGALWHDGAFWFETGATTRKGRNLARDPRCTLTLALLEFDLVVEGEAHLVTDPATVAELAQAVGRGLALHGRRERNRAHRSVQRPVGRPAAVARVPDRCERRDRAADRRARRRNPLDLLLGTTERSAGERPDPGAASCSAGYVRRSLPRL